jgi:hypothetical protein
MRWRNLILLAGYALPFAPFSAHASSCVQPVTQKIAFDKGATCWSYSGSATHFEGRFPAGQKVSVTMTGALLEYDDKTKKTTTKWAARVPSVDGPQDFHAEGDFDKNDGKLELTLPSSGIYKFGFFPCAMWHNPGKVQICAAPAAKPSSQ